MHIFELEERFPSEEACEKLFESLLWPKGPICPRCSKDKIWAYKCRRIFECALCMKQFSLKSHTIFHGTKLPFKTWLKAFYYVIYSSKGISSVYMGKWLGISQKSAWKMIHAIRTAMENWQIVLPPLDGILELDEKYIGGKPRPNHLGKKTLKKPRKDKQCAFIALERKGKVKVFHIEDYSEITQILRTNTSRKSRVMTDEATWYHHIHTLFASHQTVCHSLKEFARNDVHSNTAESFGSFLERIRMGVYHYLSPKHLHNYLAEAAFRWNNRTFETRKIKKGKNAGKTKKIGHPLPFVDQLRNLAKVFRYTQTRRTKNSSFKIIPTLTIPAFGL